MISNIWKIYVDEHLWWGENGGIRSLVFITFWKTSVTFNMVKSKPYHRIVLGDICNTIKISMIKITFSLLPNVHHVLLICSSFFQQFLLLNNLAEKAWHTSLRIFWNMLFQRLENTSDCSFLFQNRICSLSFRNFLYPYKTFHCWQKLIP